VPKLNVWNQSEFKAKELLINVHCLFDNVIYWEILLDLFFIDAVKLFFKDVGVKVPIPGLQNGLRVSGFFSLQILKSLELLSTSLLKLGNQRLLEILNIHRSLCHPDR
jgi:hypothetical protein